MDQPKYIKVTGVRPLYSIATYDKFAAYNR
jgi:hypothetical protein